MTPSRRRPRPTTRANQGREAVSADPSVPQGPRLRTRVQAAKDLAVSPRTIWSLTASGALPCVRIGRAVRYDVADLEAFVNARRACR